MNKWLTDAELDGLEYLVVRFGEELTNEECSQLIAALREERSILVETTDVLRDAVGQRDAARAKVEQLGDALATERAAFQRLDYDREHAVLALKDALAEVARLTKENEAMLEVLTEAEYATREYSAYFDGCLGLGRAATVARAIISNK